MTEGNNLTSIDIARANQILQEEHVTFEQRRRQEQAWFILRVVMGYTSILLLGAILAVSTFILIRNKDFPSSVVAAAGAALFGDVLGLLVGVWKIVLNPDTVTKLSPVTQARIPQGNEAGK